MFSTKVVKSFKIVPIGFKFMSSKETTFFESPPEEPRKDITRLRSFEHCILNNVPPKPDPNIEHHKSLKFHRQMYALYGERSGVNPGLLWPTKQDLEDLDEIERLEYPEPMHVMLANAKAKRNLEATIIMEREKKIKENLKKLNQYKRQVLDKREKRLAEYYAQKEKKQKLIEEIRDYFGYDVSPKDPKFQEMLEDKEKQEKKLKRQKKKEERQAQEMAKLLGMSQVPPET